MQAHDSRAEYERRLNRVTDHIDRHLAQPLDVATLAGVARFSPSHFHRLFIAWTGETLGGYLKRRRAESGALRMLRHPSLALPQVAAAVGFRSGEAFARAFKARFGLTPRAWRASKSHFDQALGLDRAPHPHPTRSHGGLDVRLVERQPTDILYRRHAAPFGDALVRFWSERVMPRLASDGLLDQARYGLVMDDPHHADPRLTDFGCRYDAGCELPRGHRPAPGWMTTTVSGGRYAVLDFDGPAAEAPQAWLRLLRDWLPASGLQFDARPCVEHYAASGRVQLCLPVAPLSVRPIGSA